MNGTPQPGELPRLEVNMRWDDEAMKPVPTVFPGCSTPSQEAFMRQTKPGGMTLEEAVRMMSPQAKDAIQMMLDENESLREGMIAALAERDGAFKAGFSAAKRKLAADVVAAEEPGAHDYNGPSEPVLDSDGVPTGRRRAVANEVHERFHKAIGDVMAGKVIPAARKQMDDALDRAPKFEETTASTVKPMNPGAIRFAGQDIGLKSPWH